MVQLYHSLLRSVNHSLDILHEANGTHRAEFVDDHCRSEASRVHLTDHRESTLVRLAGHRLDNVCTCRMRGGIMNGV